MKSQTHSPPHLTFFIDGSSDYPLKGSVGLPIDQMKPFTESDLSDHKKRYLEMTARHRGWGKARG